MESTLLTTKDVAEKLGVSVNRVQAMIRANRLPATRIGRDFVIQESDLALVSDRKAGRPKKEGAAEDEQASPPAQTRTTMTPAQKKAIADRQKQRWLDGAPGQKSPAVKAKATKKGGKK